MKIKRGSDLLEHPVLIQKGIFSTDEAEKILGWPRKQLNPILFRLIRKGKLARIKRGLFCIRPPGTRDLAEGYPHNWFLIARALVKNQRYFVSHYSAMQLHAMTSESIQTIFVSVAEQIRTPKHLRIPIHLVTIPKDRFWGLEEKWVTHEEKVWVSGLERTVIDLLDRPDLSGGMMEISRGLWLVRKKIDSRKLVDYAKRFGSYAAAKRLGFLMERFGMGLEKELRDLRRFAGSSISYAFLDPTRGKTGPSLGRWRLRLNQDPSEIDKNLMT